MNRRKFLLSVGAAPIALLATEPRKPKIANKGDSVKLGSGTLSVKDLDGNFRKLADVVSFELLEPV